MVFFFNLVGLKTVILFWQPRNGRGLALGGSADGCGGWSGTLLITVAGSVSLQAGYSAASAPLRSGRITANPWSQRAPSLKKVRTQPDKPVICRVEDAPRTLRGNSEKKKTKQKQKTHYDVEAAPALRALQRLRDCR